MLREKPKISNREVLDAIRCGRIYVDTKTATVWSVVGRRKVPIRQFYSDTGYLRCRIRIEGERRNIAVHSLVWMAANDRTVPPWNDIHHVDGNKLNNHYSNLEAVH